ncbi:hypothetical protein BJY04DRAFT_105196 [Aspergillus karnatakaensis]|uniref:uncharacterized protein n=1 Tax=Aspergillus karnatakaensis TaxID=1810916 RepID=UPI003CCD70D9
MVGLVGRAWGHFVHLFFLFFFVYLSSPFPYPRLALVSRLSPFSSPLDFDPLYTLFFTPPPSFFFLYLFQALHRWAGWVGLGTMSISSFSFLFFESSVVVCSRHHCFLFFT